MKKIGYSLLLLLIFLAGGGTVYYILTLSNRVKIKKESQANFIETQSQNPLPQRLSKVKNIILLIGDGMGLAQVSAGMAVNKDRLELERCTHIGLSKTSAADKYITDSAASGTAMSSGKKTNNGMIAMTPDGTHTETILEIAEKRGLKTGLVATSTITHATPASFIAHEEKRGSYHAIAADFLKTEVDVVIGGGRAHFNEREDGKDLLQELEEMGYAIYDNIADIATTSAEKFYGLCAGAAMPTIEEGRGEFLRQAVEAAIKNLSKHEQGFFLMAEASQIDWGGHANNGDYVVTEMLDFDQTIGKVLDFALADSETLVIITADHETGGLTLTDFDKENQEINLQFSTTHHTPIMVPVYAFGPGAELFTGIYENTEIFHKMLSVLGPVETADIP